MIRWKFTFDKDAEQDWLNDYAQQGWGMTRFFAGKVTFEPCQPGEYIYQIDLVPGKGLRADKYEDYVIFMNEMGVEVLQRWGRWVYLRKRAEDGPFEVYTDATSKIGLYRSMRAMFAWVLVLECLCSASAWNMLAQTPESMFARAAVGFYIVITAVMLRAVCRCSWKIRELERQGR